MLFSTLTTVAIVIFVFVTLLFVVSILLKRNDIADIAWGFGIILVAITSYILRTADSTLLLVLVALVALWGVRLSARIYVRNSKKGEDFRYKQWRESWGVWFFPRSYAQVYLLQGLLMIVVGYSVVHASVYATAGSFGALTVIGVVIWMAGCMFETVGDWQLDRFIRNKPAPGSILSTGLWRYSRHPNYFGEVTQWWGIWFMVASLPLGFVALISPLAITFLILKVSGIPMLEKAFEGNEAFEAYKKRTSAFFPLPPKAD